MRWANIIKLRLRSFLRRNTVEQELAEELEFHLEHQIERNLAAGMSPDEARRAARREFGNLGLQQDECRQARGTMLLENLIDDLRYAARVLRRDPVLALAATATLAIAIGANTSMFSLVNSILLRPLPYPDSERIYWIAEHMG